MKIGIEAQRLLRRKKHGMDLVALELIRHLQRIDTVNDYVVFVKPGPDRYCIPQAPNFRVVELHGGFYPLWEQIALPRAASREGCDILHCTGNTAPIFCSVPLITIIHDIIYLEQISLFTKGGTLYQKFGNMYRRWVVPIIARKSVKVSTVSDFEKRRIGAYLDLNDNLVTVYNGVGEHFRKITDAAMLDAARIKYHLPKEFVFFLGNTDPKKNTPNVLKAFALFNETTNHRYKLVMPDYDEPSLMKTLREIGHPDLRKDIVITGYIVNNELPAIINQCKVFLYPSQRESFGIPILEGMACGVPVITSNTSSMPEIAGEAAVIVDPNHPEEIAAAIHDVLSDPDFAAALCRKGLARAAMFSWQAMAKQYLSLYTEVFHSGKNISNKK